jgi:hypothetical protein
MNDFAIYTVATGHYKFGLFALIKSIRKMGYDGKIIIGTDKIIPEIVHLEQVEQIILQSNYVFGNLKAQLILTNPSKHFLFLDADIIVTNNQFIPFIQKKLQQSQRLILCIEGIIVKNEARRVIWSELEGTNLPIQTDNYYNTGMFAGIFSEHEEILKLWNQRIHKYLEPNKFLRTSENFPWADQDILNMNVQHLPEEKIFSIAMPDWVGTGTSINSFFPCGYFSKPLFVHATGKLKTWLLKKIPLYPPNAYDIAFYEYYKDSILDIKTDLKFSTIQEKWLAKSRLTRLYIKIKRSPIPIPSI